MPNDKIHRSDPAVAEHGVINLFAGGDPPNFELIDRIDDFQIILFAYKCLQSIGSGNVPTPSSTGKDQDGLARWGLSGRLF